MLVAREWGFRWGKYTCSRCQNVRFRTGKCSFDFSSTRCLILFLNKHIDYDLCGGPTKLVWTMPTHQYDPCSRCIRTRTPLYVKWVPVSGYRNPTQTSFIRLQQDRTHRKLVAGLSDPRFERKQRFPRWRCIDERCMSSMAVAQEVRCETGSREPAFVFRFIHAYICSSLCPEVLFVVRFLIRFLRMLFIASHMVAFPLRNAIVVLVSAVRHVFPSREPAFVCQPIAAPISSLHYCIHCLCMLWAAGRCSSR